MKTILILAFSCLTGCASLQPAESAAKRWWDSPATQAGVATGERIALQTLESVALNAAGQEITGGKLDLSALETVAVTSGLRQLETTPGASDVAAIVATAAAIKNPTTAKAIGATALNAVETAVSKNQDPSGALEGVARALEAGK